MAKTATNAAHVRFYYVKCLLGPTGPHTLHTDKDYNSNLRCLLSALAAIVIVVSVLIQWASFCFCKCSTVTACVCHFSHFTFIQFQFQLALHLHFARLRCVFYFTRAPKSMQHTICQATCLFGLSLHLPLSAHSTPLQSRLTVRRFCARANWQLREIHPHTTGTAERTTRFVQRRKLLAELS